MGNNTQYEKLVGFVNDREQWLIEQREKIRLTIVNNKGISGDEVELMALIGASEWPVEFLRSKVSAVQRKETTPAEAVDAAMGTAKMGLLRRNPYGTFSMGSSLLISNLAEFWRDFSFHMGERY